MPVSGNTDVGARLSRADKLLFERNGAACPVLDVALNTAGDFLNAIYPYQPGKGSTKLWFRGHEDVRWELCPNALRPKRVGRRVAALELLDEFKRRAHAKLPSSDRPSDDLTWLGLAQHYGLPTRLLDWSTNPSVALYFACCTTDSRVHGAVYLMNPTDLYRVFDPTNLRVLDANRDRAAIEEYLRLGPGLKRNGKPTIAINPVHHTERIDAQQGKFTLHGDLYHKLTAKHVPSLVCIPVRRAAKKRILADLVNTGISESSLFPELEYLCRELCRSSGFRA